MAHSVRLNDWAVLSFAGFDAWQKRSLDKSPTSLTCHECRRIKYRYYPSLGYGDFDAAQRFCQAVDEVGHVLRPCTHMAEFVCLGDRKERFRRGVEDLEALFRAA